MFWETLAEQAAQRLSTSPSGLAALLASAMVIGGFSFGGWARRRYLVDLRVLREVVELEQLTGQSQQELGLSTEAALASARRWRNWAYERSGFLRFVFGAMFVGLVLMAMFAGLASIGRFVAGAILAGLGLMALLVVISAVIFVLVSDLGAQADEPADPGVDAPQN